MNSRCLLAFTVSQEGKFVLTRKKSRNRSRIKERERTAAAYGKRSRNRTREIIDVVNQGIYNYRQRWQFRTPVSVQKRKKEKKESSHCSDLYTFIYKKTTVNLYTCKEETKKKKKKTENSPRHLFLLALTRGVNASPSFLRETESSRREDFSSAENFAITITILKPLAPFVCILFRFFVNVYILIANHYVNTLKTYIHTRTRARARGRFILKRLHHDIYIYI